MSSTHCPKLSVIVIFDYRADYVVVCTSVDTGVTHNFHHCFPQVKVEYIASDSHTLYMTSRSVPATDDTTDQSLLPF